MGTLKITKTDLRKGNCLVRKVGENYAVGDLAVSKNSFMSGCIIAIYDTDNRTQRIGNSFNKNN